MFHKIVFDFDERGVAEELQKKLLTCKCDTIFDYCNNPIDYPNKIGYSKWVVWIDEDIIEKYNTLYTEFGKLEGIEAFKKTNIAVVPNYYKLVRQWNTATNEEKESFKELLYNLFDGQCEITCKPGYGLVDIEILKAGYNPISLYMIPTGRIDSRNGRLPGSIRFYNYAYDQLLDLIKCTDNDYEPNIVKNIIKIASQGFGK